jgi:hypothetical protein
MTLPVLPMRPGVIDQDVDTIYRFLQALTQQSDAIASKFTFITYIPTVLDIEDGQGIFSYVNGTFAAHINVSNVILTLNIGEPLP